MTNWLITQTTRFKAAVTGAGGVENVADWGNDDSTVGRRLFSRRIALGSARPVSTAKPRFSRSTKCARPRTWSPERTIFASRVLERLPARPRAARAECAQRSADFSRGRARLDKNPWHGKIKVREELKWLEKYGGVKAHELERVKSSLGFLRRLAAVGLQLSIFWRGADSW